MGAYAILNKDVLKEIRRRWHLKKKSEYVFSFRHDRHKGQRYSGTLHDLREFFGHKLMTMTLRYGHQTQESKIKAVNLLGTLTAFNAGDCHKTVKFADATKTATV